MGLKIVLLVVFGLIELFDIFLSVLSLRYNKPIPANVADVYDEDTYKKREEYKKERLKLDVYKKIFLLICAMLILAFNVHSIVFDFIGRFISNIYAKCIFLFAAFMIFDTLIEQPFEIFDTFKIEQKYGFNKSTVKTYCFDTLIKLIFFTLILIGAMSIIMALFESLGYWSFLVLLGSIMLLFLVFLLFGKQISKTMNRYTPLSDGELKTKIEEFAAKEGFSIKSISVMNASKRSTRLNATCGGVGKLRSIVLYDTLIESLTPDEVVAVLAHEFGHAKYRHSVKSLISVGLQYAALIAFACFVVVSKSISVAFGFDDMNVAFGFIMFFNLVSPVLMLVSIPSNIINRKHERQADRFAVKQFNKESFISALKKIAGKNFVGLTPHPFIVMLKAAHPPLAQRIEYIEGIN